jgi:hypothetical protein
MSAECDPEDVQRAALRLRGEGAAADPPASGIGAVAKTWMTIRCVLRQGMDSASRSANVGWSASPPSGRPPSVPPEKPMPAVPVPPSV